MIGATRPGHRLWLLGGLRVEAEAGPLALPGGKPQALLAYLLLHPHTPHTREQLMDTLWPEAAADRAGRYLSNALYRLRAVLSGDWLQVADERLSLRRERLWVDVWEFERLAKSTAAADWDQALALYAGELLPEVYDDWILLPRLSLRERHLTLLTQAAEACAAEARWPEAGEHFRRLAAADPLNEAALRGVMQALARMGRLAEALDAFEQLQTSLQAELGVPPAEATRALAEQLRNEMTVERPAQSTFVGRVPERAQLIARLERAQSGHGGFAVVLGDAGMGKTRLLAELEQAAGWRGWRTARARGEELGLPAPYAPLSLALGQALPEVRQQQLARILEPVWLQWTSGLVPNLAQHASKLAPSGPPDTTQMARALARVLSALGRLHPHLILLDDVHWADPEMWRVLGSLRGLLSHAPVLVVLSGRRDEWQRQPGAWQAVGEWDRDGEPIIHLDGLRPEELRQLLAPRAFAADQLRQLQAASGGNPLLALELAQARDVDSLLHTRPGLSDLALRRLAALSADARRALQAASLIGYQFQYALWEALILRLPLPAAQLPEWAGELERARLLHVDSDGYAFAHDTLRAAVYGTLAEPELGQWHAHVLAILDEGAEGDPAEKLNHARRAGNLAAIARHAHAAGERALAGFAYHAAAAYLAEAFAALPLDATRARFEVLRDQAEALRILADRETLPGVLQALSAHAAELSDPALQAEAALQHSRHAWQIGEFERGQTEALRGLALAPHDSLRADLCAELGRIARDKGDYAGARNWFGEALSHYAAAGSEAGQAAMKDVLGIVAQRLGRTQDAIALHTAARQTFNRLGDIRAESHALSNLGVALWMRGDFAAAREAFERVLPISRDLGDANTELAALANLAALAGGIGDYERALELHHAALKLARASNHRARLANLLGNTGDTLFYLGQHAEARAAFEEALQLNRVLGRRRGEGYVLHSLGEVLLEEGRMPEAQVSFEAALNVRVELVERDNAVVTRAYLAAAHLSQRQRPQAEAAIQTALGDLDAHASPEIRRDVHLLAYRVRVAVGEDEVALAHLRAAEAAVRELADKLAPEDRARFLERVPYNRRLVEAVAQHARIVTVRLARADSPLGRSLTDTDFVSVHWTVSTVSDATLLRPTERRRHIVRRLLAEAEAQGAAPTDDDLARALGVARRTIERDMAALQAAGQPLPTRRRKSSA